MKGLIIQQPWIRKITDKEKKWEIRTKGTNERGRVALVESGLTSGDKKQFKLSSIKKDGITWNQNRVLGTANLVDCLEIPRSEMNSAENFANHKVPGTLMNSYIKPTKNPFAFVLEDVVKFEKPVIVEVKKGTINWPTLSGDEEQKILAEEKRSLDLIA